MQSSSRVMLEIIKSIDDVCGFEGGVKKGVDGGVTRKMKYYYSIKEKAMESASLNYLTIV